MLAVKPPLPSVNPIGVQVERLEPSLNVYMYSVEASMPTTEAATVTGEPTLAVAGAVSPAPYTCREQ